MKSIVIKEAPEVVNEIEMLLSLPELVYEELNKKLVCFILEEDDLIASHSNAFPDEAVMNILVYIENNKAHIDYRLYAADGEEIEGRPKDTYAGMYSIVYKGITYVCAIEKDSM